MTRHQDGDSRSKIATIQEGDRERRAWGLPYKNYTTDQRTAIVLLP